MTEEKFKEVIKVAKTKLIKPNGEYLGVCISLRRAFCETTEYTPSISIDKRNIIMPYLSLLGFSINYWLDRDAKNLPIRETMLELLELFVISENLYEEL